MSQVAKILTLALFCGCFLVASQTSAASAVKPIYSMAVSGNITLNKIDGYARIILTDAQGKEYLMYEASGPFDSGSFSFENTCEETCVLNGIIPKKVDVEVLGAEIHIDKLLIIEDRTAMNTQVQTMGMQTYAEALDPVQEDVKIVKINQYIQNSGMKWTAGKTSVSEYSYEQKKVLFGIPINEELSNLQGFEYYTGGVFEIAGANASPKSASASNLPSSFDWRDRHGENWMTPVKNQNDPQEYGSCWAFSSIGTVEATANLHFNQQLNLDLSEQELVSCFPRSCDGLIPTEKPALIEHISSIGLIPETCFPYTATNSQCENKCQGWQNSTLKINNGIYINNDENEIKRTLIAEGPLWASSVYAIPGHAMILSGYDTNPYDNIPIWIFKNSWGLNWGEQGYLRTPSLSGILIQPEFVYIKISDNQPNYSNLKINCVNKDGDNYCNWGISETKPAVDCPSSCSENKKDCDDSNSNLGPFDLNYNCIPIGAGSPDKEPPYVGKIFVTPPTETFYKSGTYVFKVEIKDNQGISGCEFLDNEYPVGQMILDSPYCKHCYAEKEYWVGLTEGQKSLSARCWDKADNSSVGDVLEIEILPTVSPVVGTISPSAAIINQSQNFLASVSDDIGVTRCQLKINDASGLIEVAIMTLSDSPCVNCAASQSYSFSSDGNYSMRATCWDGDNNITEGPLVEIRVSSFGGNGELSVGKITPSTAQLNVRKRFSTMVSDDGEVLACALKINNTPVEYMNFSESPCNDCTASVDYTFTSRGSYSVLARCLDNDGNAKEGEPVNISIGQNCPDCHTNNTDRCETPPKCEKDCEADSQCDEEERNSSWTSSGNTCNGCGNGCEYNIDTSKPQNHELYENICYYNCNISCNPTAGWKRILSSSNCKTENCPQIKVGGNICYYLRSCGTGGCRYLNTDTNKECSLSSCTESGWINDLCQGEPKKPYNKELYMTEGFNNSDDYISGYLFCDSDDLIVSGDCVPDDNNDIVASNWQTGSRGWFCEFECDGWCTADGTIKITCQP